MKVFHHTFISRVNPNNTVEFDETLNDYIWMRIHWWMVTRDIDLSIEGGSRKHAILHHTDLPYPNIAAGKFIPFDNVGDRDLLRWIHETEGYNNIFQKQRQNLAGFIKKYDLHDQWRGKI